MSELTVKIDQAAIKVFGERLEGWVGDRIPHMLMFAQGYHEQHDIQGDILEIGIHHGALFFMMAAAAREGEKCIAVDLFENQALNVDSSGKGDLGQFSRNIDAHFPEIRDSLHVVSSDSMAIRPSQAGEILNTRGVRLFSVDGGHTKHHVLNDLGLAQELLVGGGMILLDDFFNPHWPGVAEGFYEFMATQNKRLAPFALLGNKLFMTTFSEQEAMLVAFRAFADASYGDEIHHRWRYATVSGFQVLTFV